MAELILVTGGCRSGKSRFALRMASPFTGDKIFLATAPKLDSEMEERIRLHREERENLSWTTIEEEVSLAERIPTLYPSPNSVLLIDCLSLWINNLMYQAEKENLSLREDAIREKSISLAKAALHSEFHSVYFVSSEVGLGLVPETKQGRIYRDLLGTSNQTFAQLSHKMYFLVSGIPITIK